MKLLDDYNKARQELFDYFGYVEGCVVIPIDDATEYYWYLTGEGYGDVVQFAENKDDVVYRTDNYYENEVCTQRFLKWVYRKDAFTKICVDTRTDGNKFLQIFDNSKEIARSSLDYT